MTDRRTIEDEQNDSDKSRWGFPFLKRSLFLDEDENQQHYSHGLFYHMATYPWPFLFFLPVVFAVLISLGWSKDRNDIVENQVANIWISTSGSYARDRRYLRSLGRVEGGVSTFAAMAIGRDGGNLFTASRLEEIRARMEKTERTMITYKGVTYDWSDICASYAGAEKYTYEFPCARLSPVDLFQEANWFMNYTGPDSIPDDPFIPAPKQDLYRRTWYHKMIREQVVKPLLPRFETLQKFCLYPCMELLAYRLNPNSTGYSPVALLGDIATMGMNEACRICIETNYESTIQNLTNVIVPSFIALTDELQKFSNSNSSDALAKAEAVVLSEKTGRLISSIDANDVQEFYFYYALRDVYSQIGPSILLEDYSRLQDAIVKCQQGEQLAGITCPPTNITTSQAGLMLRNWADNVFSSVSTAGSPLPFWSKGDGTGELYKGNSPVGGSGINMSGTIDSLFEYLDLPNYGLDNWQPLFGSDQFADPTSALWREKVETNPIYAWFIANFTDADEETGCGNDLLPGVSTGVSVVDESASNFAQTATQYWCTKYNIPNTNNTGSDGPYSKQHFAKMWYNLLVDSLLGIVEGVHDPYTWTLGKGCGYVTAGERDPFTNRTDESILYNASRDLYFIDEGEFIGVLSPALLIGDAIPPVGAYSFDNPLKKVGLLQTIYAAALPADIVQRVRHCKRPGSPVNISLEDAKEILFQWKIAMEYAWTEGWDNNDYGQVQFVGMFDDIGVIGSMGRALEDMTLDNSTLTAVAICLIIFFSILFLAGPNWVESRALITLIGITLIVLGFFAAMGFGLLLGIKISVAIAWTLPFLMLGLASDDVYIVLFSLKLQQGYSKRHFCKAMEEVIVPVTMTSVVNLSMFAILNISDIPAVYLTSQIAVYCVVALYLMVIFCYPAWCYLDLRRQNAGRKDILFCSKATKETLEISRPDIRQRLLYENFYRPLVLGSHKVRLFTHSFIWIIAAALFITGCYGITQRRVGFGLEDGFPSDSQAHVWATERTESLASLNVEMNWGAINYTDPTTQMKMIKQFEDVVNTTYVVKVDTNQLWISELLLWSSRHCTKNYGRDDFNTRKCGYDVLFTDNTPCAGSWVRNDWGLQEQIFRDYNDTTCQTHKGGICRPLSRMHPDDIVELAKDLVLYDDDVFCPVISGWSDEKWQFCLQQWRNLTGTNAGQLFVREKYGSPTECSGLYNNDQNVSWPIRWSSGPTLMFANYLFTHEDTLELLSQTRAICDNDKEIHCWMSGVPYDYWTQYENISEVLLRLAGYSTLVGFLISYAFLFGEFFLERRHSMLKIVLGSLIGSLFIVLTIVLSTVAAVGIGILAGVRLTAASTMSFVLSVGFTVEYSVHIVVRFLHADSSHTTGLDRIQYTMSFLTIPTCMSFLSSMIGVVCLAFTDFDFVRVFAFQPLVIVMAVTYFHGCWWLPALLSMLNWDIIQLGETVNNNGLDEITQKRSNDDSREAGCSETLERSEPESPLNDNIQERLD